MIMKYIHTQTSIPEEDEYPKLVRDEIPNIIKANDGIEVDVTCVKGSNDHKYYLQKKLLRKQVSYKMQRQRNTS